MQQKWDISLSPKDENGLVVVQQENGEQTPMKERDLEIQILRGLFEFAGALQKEAMKIQCIRDCVGQLDNLTGEETVFTVDSDDKEALKQAIEHTAGVDQNGRPKRPMLWMKARRIFGAIHEMAKHDEKPKEG